MRSPPPLTADASARIGSKGNYRVAGTSVIGKVAARWRSFLRHPGLAIIDTAESKGCDLIVMASHGRHGISAIVLGSETVKVLTHSKIPVLVHR
jgi:hypothetical protein